MNAMKVSTDACIQGAWTAEFIRNQGKEGIEILDIGTGTGLLSLMLVQELVQIAIDGIDTEKAAVMEAGINFANSPWKQQLHAKHASLQNYQPGKLYDYIICNPPFFHKQLQATGASRNTARHDILLSKSDLAYYASQLLKTSGYLSVLFPCSEWEGWLATANAEGLNLYSQLLVFPRSNKPANRIIGIFSKTSGNNTLSNDLVIRENDNQYTAAFIQLMQPYYLHL